MPAPTLRTTLARPLALAAGLALAIAALAAHAQEVIHWASAVDGDFAVAENWSPMMVPGVLDTAVLGGIGPYVVGVSSRTDVGRVVLTNPQAELHIGHNSDLYLYAGYSGPGEIVVSDGVTTRGNAGLFVEGGAVLNGHVRLNGAEPKNAFVRSPSGERLLLGADNTITGRGKIVGVATNAGTLAPGTGEGGIGRFELGVLMDLEPTARLEIDAAGAADGLFDHIRGSSSVTLGGSLDVDFVDGYVPQPHDRFDVLIAPTVHGEFNTVDIEDVPGAGPAHVLYGTSIVTVVVCAADRDGDGELTARDYLLFQMQFDFGDLRADLDGDGSLTVFDLLFFQNRFAAGCG